MLEPVRTRLDQLDDVAAGKVAVTQGGTGSATAAAARTALGLAIGTDVAAATHTHTASQVTDLGAWAGSTAITTLGTIATGTWQGAVIGPTYLGTGTRTGAKYLRDDGTWQAVAGGGGGTVTSVDLSVPSGLSVGGNPVTGSGTLAISTALAGIVKGTGSGFASASSSDITTAIGTVSDPAWILSLAGSKIIGSIGGNAAGISGSITISQISNLNAYTGGVNITSVGTLTVGTWQATAIGTAYGGVPSGGTTGQVLKKNSNTSYDYAWAADATAGGGGSIATTTNVLKGDGAGNGVAATPGTDYLTPSGAAAAYQPLDGDLTSIAAISANGWLKRTAANTWSTASLSSGDIPDLSATYASLSGSYANPAWITSLAASKMTGTVAVANGGTGLATVASGKLLYASALDTLSALTLGTTLGITGGTLDVSGSVVTAVVLNSSGLLHTSPTTFTVAGGTATGTMALATQAANKVVAGPTTGAAAAPTFRSLVAADIPTTGLTITQHIAPMTVDTDGSTVTFDLSASDWHEVTLGGNRTLALSNPTVGQQFSVVLKQDATGGRTVTWWSGIRWMGGSAPTLTATASKWDFFTFRCMSSGVYAGFVAGANA